MQDLLNRIKKVEALIAGASTEGEKNAAVSAKSRILKNHPNLVIHKNPKEFRLTVSDTWQKKLLLALCRKYGVEPYRYRRQKRTTVMLYINEGFLNNVLWKEYLEYSKHLKQLIASITNELIAGIHPDQNENIRDDSVSGGLT